MDPWLAQTEARPLWGDLPAPCLARSKKGKQQYIFCHQSSRLFLQTLDAAAVYPYSETVVGEAQNMRNGHAQLSGTKHIFFS